MRGAGAITNALSARTLHGANVSNVSEVLRWCRVEGTTLLLHCGLITSAPRLQGLALANAMQHKGSRTQHKQHDQLAFASISCQRQLAAVLLSPHDTNTQCLPHLQLVHVTYSPHFQEGHLQGYSAHHTPFRQALCRRSSHGEVRHALNARITGGSSTSWSGNASQIMRLKSARYPMCIRPCKKPYPLF
mgnify:CR=1 FL=1